MGVWSGATDGYDVDFDVPDTLPDAGYASIYHEFDADTWKGPTDFYRLDYRAPLAPGETKTWAPIHLWADPDGYGEPLMTLVIMPGADLVPPDDLKYTLELVYVPEGITEAPPVGTTWTLEPDKTLEVEVPTYAAYSGRDAYQFAFTAAPIPEPATLLALSLAALCVRRRLRGAVEDGAQAQL